MASVLHSLSLPARPGAIRHKRSSKCRVIHASAKHRTVPGSMPKQEISAAMNKQGAILLSATIIGLGILLHSNPAQAIDHMKQDHSQVVGDLGMGPEGPLLEEFWENMRRYGIYFVTVATGGLYTIVKPIFDLLTNPATAVLALIVIAGSFYLLYVTLSAMLGLTPRLQVMAEEVLRNLNLSSEERCRLTKCMKDPKFMELLTEYTNEISVPANKAEAEAYIKLAEDRQNFSMEGKELIIPVAGFCVKTRNKNGKKVFINICHTTNIDKPIAKTHHGKGQQWSIPYSLGPARNEVDKSGSECEVYDFVVNEEAHERAMKNNRFKRFLAETAMENVRKQRNVELEQDYTLPKLKYKGTTSNPKMQTVRKAFHESNTSIKTDSSKTKPPPTPNSSGSNIQDTNSSSNEKQPSYEFIYRDDFDLGQFWTDQSVVQNTSKKPKSIVLRMSLPKVESASEVDLNVSGTEVFLHVRGKYKLKLNTAYPVDFKNGRAQFDKANHKLEIVMPTM